MFTINNKSMKQIFQIFPVTMKEEYLNILRVGVAEVLGTGLLLFLGCMSCVEIGGFKPSHLTICIGFGLAVMLIVNIFGNFK